MALTTEEFMELTADCPVIPAAKNDEWLEACLASESKLVYVLYGDICNIADIVKKLKEKDKKVIVHIDLIEGLTSKEICVDFIKKYTMADGIISLKPTMIKRAKDLGIFTIQRFYMMDGRSYTNIVKHVRHTNPEVVEFMPAGLTKLIPYLVHEVDKPVVASGLIQDKEDVMGALKAGAMAVSNTNRKVWDC